MTNSVMKTASRAGIFRRILLALLLTLGSSHLLAQQRDSGVTPFRLSEQLVALATGNSAGAAAPSAQRVDAVDSRSSQGAPQLLAAPATIRGPTQAQRPNGQQRRAPGSVFRDCAGCPEMVVIPPGEFTQSSANGATGQVQTEDAQR